MDGELTGNNLLPEQSPFEKYRERAWEEWWGIQSGGPKADDVDKAIYIVARLAFNAGFSCGWEPQRGEGR
jgi:hypothetical protein